MLIKTKSNRQLFLNYCRSGELEMIKRQLTNPEFNASLNEDVEKGFVLACAAGHLEVVKYLLQSKDIPKNAKTLQGLQYACIYKKMHVVQWFVFDYKIRADGAVEEMILELSDKETQQTIKNYFNTRQLNKNLNESLKENVIEKNKIKI